MAKRKAATKMKIRKVIVRVTMAVNGVLKTHEKYWGAGTNRELSVGSLIHVEDQWASVASVAGSARGPFIAYLAMEFVKNKKLSPKWKLVPTTTRDTASYIDGLAALVMKKMEWKAIEQLKQCQDAANDAARSSRDVQMARDAIVAIADRAGLCATPRKFVTLRVPAEMVEREY